MNILNIKRALKQIENIKYSIDEKDLLIAVIKDLENTLKMKENKDDMSLLWDYCIRKKLGVNDKDQLILLEGNNIQYWNNNLCHQHNLIIFLIMSSFH